MAASNKYRDTASDFNTQYTDPESRFAAGVAKTRVKRGDSNRNLNERPSEGRRGRTAARLYRGAQEQNINENTLNAQKLARRYYPDETTQQNQLSNVANINSAPLGKKIVQTSDFARARGVTFGIVTMSWLAPIYIFWQIPIAIIGAILLGLSLQVETSYLLSALDTAGQAIGSLFGYEYIDLVGIGMLTIITTAFFGVMCACVAGFTAVLWGLHPLSGNAAGTKKATFILGIVGACMPFANMFPWIVFWVLVMMRHPK